MISTFMVPLDGYPLAERALPMAIRLARRAGGRLHLVHALDMLMQPRFIDRVSAEQWWREGAPQGAHDYLERIAARLRLEQQLPATTAVIDGPIVSGLVGEARRVNADLAVMMTHGRGPIGRMWIGSVADGFVRQAPCPVTLLRADTRADADRPLRNILVTIDGSDVAEEIVTYAADLAELEGGLLTLLHIAHPHVSLLRQPAAASQGPLPPEEMAQAVTNYLTEIALREIHNDCNWRVDVVTSELSTASEILRYAEEHAIDLIAIGTRGHGGVRRLLMGSVADKVLRAAPIPVMVYRPATESTLHEWEDL